MTSKAELIKLIERKRKSGVYLSILGFGRGNLNDATMEALADKGNGNYSYIDSVAEARKVLVEGASTLVTIAKDVKIQLEFNSQSVESYRLIGYENRVMSEDDFANDSADAGELGPGHSVSALYEFRPKTDSNTENIAELRLRYKTPDSQASQLLTQSISTKQPDLVSSEMRFATAVAGFALLLKRSEYTATLGWAQIEAMAEDALGEAPDSHRKEFLELVRVARGLSVSESQLAQ